MLLMPNMYKIITLRQMQENHYFKMHLAPHMYETITLQANAKEIVTLKCI